MKKLVLFLLCTTFIFNLKAQNDGFIKADNNIEYKIYPSAQGDKIGYGNFIKMHVIQLYRGTIDSVLYDSEEYASPIQPVDTLSLPMYYYSILMQLKNNDSVVMRIIVDSAYKNSEMPMPSIFEPGKYLYTCIKVNDIFDTKDKADSASTIEQQIMTAKEIAKNEQIFIKENEVIKNYLVKNNIIGAIKLPLGTYIKVVKKGVGNNATSNDKVKVNYTGKNLAGKSFDSSTDPAFGHVAPYEVDLSKNPVQVIEGWQEALKNLNKGSKAIIFVPSPLAYGSRGYPPAIQPNEILMFDMEIVAITPVNAPAIKPTTKITTKPKTKSSKPVVKTKAKPKKK